MHSWLKASYAVGSTLAHRPDNDRLDPDFSARCTMLKKAIGEVCMRRCVRAAEPAAWQLAWLRVRCHATAAVAEARGAGGEGGGHALGAAEAGEAAAEEAGAGSIELEITKSRHAAQALLDDAACFSSLGAGGGSSGAGGEGGGGGGEGRAAATAAAAAAAAAGKDARLRNVLLERCGDGTLASPHGRLLFFEVCIEAFARMHGASCTDARLCSELERMSAFLINTGGLKLLVYEACSYWCMRP